MKPNAGRVSKDSAAHGWGRLCAVSVTAVVAIVSTSGCATPPPASREWGTEAEVVARPVDTGPETQQEFDAQALEAISAQRCENIARDVFDRNKKKAAMMMRGCMKRDDFQSLYELSKPPWNGMKFKESDIPLVLAVTMRNGGIEAAKDFKQVGLPVVDWESLTHAETPDRQLIIVRVQVISQKQTNRGEYTSLVRLYGFNDGRRAAMSYRYDRATAEYKREMGREGRDTRNVVPLGQTMHVVSSSPLPKDVRVQIVARYNKPGTDRLLKENAQRLANLPPEEAMAVKITDEDPPPDAAADLVAYE
jgi:hypothetical protein